MRGTSVRRPGIRVIYSYKPPVKYFRIILEAEPTTTSLVLFEIRGTEYDVTRIFAVTFTFCVTFKRAINRPKTDPRLFFFSNLFINGQAFIISGKKILIFSLLWRECKGKLLSIRGFTLLICENNYETAVTYMNTRCQLLVRQRQLLIRWKA